MNILIRCVYPSHMPSDNAIQLHTPLILPYGISENVEIAHNLHIEELLSSIYPLVHLDLFFRMYLVVSGMEFPPNMVVLHAEVPVVCSLHPGRALAKIYQTMWERM